MPSPHFFVYKPFAANETRRHLRRRCSNPDEQFIRSFWQKPKVSRELRPAVSGVRTEKWKRHANESCAPQRSVFSPFSKGIQRAVSASTRSSRESAAVTKRWNRSRRHLGNHA